jgi:hypothetical protein
LNSKTPYLYILLLGIFYLAFPSHNANIDSWYYAACAKYGQHLFHSHHLLYNVISWLCYEGARSIFPDIEAISALNIMNSVAATASLIIFYRILILLGTNTANALCLSLFCGVSFGFMRYATDAETYILPLLFSLISTWFFLRNKRLDLIWSGCFAALSILTHQLHLWWTLGMLIGLLLQKPIQIKPLIRFMGPLFLVPIIYYAVYLQIDTFQGSFIQFVSGEYDKGNADLNFSLLSALLTMINLVRTFIQVHGQIIDLIIQYPFQYLFIAIVLLCIWTYFYRKRRLKPGVRSQFIKNPYSKVFLLAFLLHLFFAFLSSGNAEFMVMLPFLFVLYKASTYRLEVLPVLLPITLVIGIWNLSTAIFPARFCDLNRVDKQVEFTISHPNDHFLWLHKPLVENVITYKKGFADTFRFIRGIRGPLLDSLIRHKMPVYTDYGNPETVLSREGFFRGANPIADRYTFISRLKWDNLYGENHIYLLSLKEK